MIPYNKIGKRLKQGDELEALLKQMFELDAVVPVIVYPGWFVKQSVKEAKVIVLNDKQVVGRLKSGPAVLDTATVERLAAFVGEKCRDVEV